MLRPAGHPTPCWVCPKAEGGRPPADDPFAEDWFWDLRQWFRECRAVGDFGAPDPLLRAAAAEFDAADRRAAARPADLTAQLLASLLPRK